MKSIVRKPEVLVASNANKGFTEPHTELISLYNRPPLQGPEDDDTITIRQFEQFAVDRLTVLQAIDRVCGLEPYIGSEPKKVNAITRALVENGLQMSYNACEKEVKARDQISHFILRLAFSRSAEKRDWFIKQETRLLRFRLDQSPNGRKKLCEYPVVSQEDIGQRTSAAVAAYVATLRASSGNQEVYQLPFEKAASLVSRRRTCVFGGQAYVLASDLDATFLTDLRENISKSMDQIQDSPLALTGVFEDLRVSEFLAMLGQMYVGADDATGKSESRGGVEVLGRQNIEMLARRSFPPCMRYMTEHLKSYGKHMHWGRLQLRLFYKGCGMKLDDQVQLWQEWMHKVSADEFRKNHLYNIRHAYGQEGKRADYFPWPCPRIIALHNPTQQGECHGCVINTHDENKLRTLLNGWGVPRQSIDEMARLKKGGHIQLACVEYFKANHLGSEADGVGNHPNDFYKLSCHYHSSKVEAANAEGALKDEEGGDVEMAA